MFSPEAAVEDGVFFELGADKVDFVVEGGVFDGDFVWRDAHDWSLGDSIL